MSHRTIWTIAWRNISGNKKRSILFGLAIFFSCFLLLLSHAIFNGAGEQIQSDMTQMYTGEVGIYWTSILDYQKNDPSRVFFSDIDVDRAEDNQKSLKVLEAQLANRKDSVSFIEPYILRQVTVYAGKSIEKTRIYSESDDAFRRLVDMKILQPSDESIPITFDNRSVYISQEFAKTLGVKVGDRINIEARTLYGSQNVLDVSIKGFFRNKAPWINRFILANDKLARELLDFDPGYFNATKIFLKTNVNAQDFVADLRKELQTQKTTLTAETEKEAGQFFEGLTASQKTMFTVITVVIFLVIGMGLRSTTRMLLFQRMREFGTLRSIGYSRMQCLYLVIVEVMLLGLLSLAVATIFVLLIILIVSLTSIRVPPGPLQYMFGGDHFYLYLNFQDLFLSVVLIAFLALFSTFKPAGVLMYNKVTDILNGTQKRVFVIPAMVKSWMTKKGSI